MLSSKSITFKLTFSVVTSLLILALFVVSIYFYGQKKISTQQVNQNLINQSKLFSNSLEHQIKRHIQQVNMQSVLVGQLLAQTQSESKAWQSALALQKPKNKILLLTKGKKIVKSTPQNWAVPNNIQQQYTDLIKPSSQHFTQQTPSQTPNDKNEPIQGQWSSLFYEPNLKQWLSLYMSVVKVNQHDYGVFASSINLDLVIQHLRLELKRTLPTADVFIYDAKQNLLFHPDYGSRLLRQQDNLHVLQTNNSIVRSSIAEFIQLDKREGQLYQYSDWGDNILASVQTLAENDWRIVVYQPQRSLLDRNEFRLAQALAVIVILSTLLMLFTMRLTRYFVTHRLRKTAKLLETVGNGDLTTRFNVQGNDEVDEINTALNQALSSLSKRRRKELHQIEQLRHEVEENKALAQAVSYSDNAVMMLELDFTISFVDTKSMNLLKCDREDLLSSRFFSHIHHLMAFVGEQIVNDIRRKQTWHGELVLKEFNSQNQVWVNSTITPMRDEHNKVTKYVVSLQDISFIKASQSKIEKLAYTDELTNLANRSYFVAQLEKFVEMNKRGHFNFALLHFDVDDFKRINDKYGYEGGDALLVQLSKRLSERLRREDIIARLGGDEFGLIIGMGDSEQSILHTANTILNLVAEPFTLKQKKIAVTTSIGITLSNEDVKDAEVLLQHADLAMFEAKNSGKNTFNFFTQELNDSVRERLDIEIALSEAISKGKLELHYQPKVNYIKQELVGYEALLRWVDDKLGFVSPAKFIPIAEQSNLILEVSDWVMEQAIIFISKLNNKVPVSINISAKQFETGSCSARIGELISNYKVAANLVEVEITESYLMSDVEEAISQLQEMKKLGISISIDDFGTGYSSLSYLKRFPVDTLKIDRSFIKDIPHDENDVEITGAIIAMANKLGLEVIAEGVETQAQIDFLRNNDCHLVQGYFYSKPLPELAAKQWTFRLDEQT